jgi:hypothetical protein
VTATIVEDYLDEIIDQMQGSTVARGRKATSLDLSTLEADWREAEAELDAFASDLTARRALGANYSRHLEARVADRDSKREAYRVAARAAAVTTLPESAQTMADKLRDLFESIEVRPGRGLKIADRVTFFPFDGDASAVASA